MTADNYQRGLERLVEYVTHIHEAESKRNDERWDRTEHKKRIEKVADELKKTADLLSGQSSELFDIEMAHDERRQPTKSVGINGWHSEENELLPSMEAIESLIRDLAESASSAAQRIPHPNTKRALPIAAKGLLHLRYECGFPKPVLSNNSEEVIDLGIVCKKASMVYSPERLRGALSLAIKDFDPTSAERWILELFQ